MQILTIQETLKITESTFQELSKLFPDGKYNGVSGWSIEDAIIIARDATWLAKIYLERAIEQEKEHASKNQQAT